MKETPKWEVLDRLFLELGVPIGIGKILTQDLLSQRLPHFNMVLEGYNLRWGRIFIQFDLELGVPFD